MCGGVRIPRRDQRLDKITPSGKALFRGHQPRFPVTTSALFIGHIDYRDRSDILGAMGVFYVVQIPIQSNVHGIAVDDSNA